MKTLLKQPSSLITDSTSSINIPERIFYTLLLDLSLSILAAILYNYIIHSKILSCYFPLFCFNHSICHFHKRSGNHNVIISNIVVFRLIFIPVLNISNTLLHFPCAYSSLLFTHFKTFSISALYSSGNCFLKAFHILLSMEVFCF